MEARIWSIRAWCAGLGVFIGRHLRPRPRSWSSGVPALLQLAADLAALVLLGVDVHVRVAVLDGLDEHAQRLALLGTRQVGRGDLTLDELTVLLALDRLRVAGGRVELDHHRPV